MFINWTMNNIISVESLLTYVWKLHLVSNSLIQDSCLLLSLPFPSGVFNSMAKPLYWSFGCNINKSGVPPLYPFFHAVALLLGQSCNSPKDGTMKTFGYFFLINATTAECKSNSLLITPSLL
jgi:hypothetical protein